MSQKTRGEGEKEVLTASAWAGQGSLHIFKKNIIQSIIHTGAFLLKTSFILKNKLNA